MHAEIDSKQAIGFIWKMIKSFPLGCFVMLATAIFWAVDLVVRPYILKILLDRIPTSGNEDILYLAAPAALWCLCYLILVTIYRVYGYFVEIHMLPNLRAKIASYAIDRLMLQSYRYYQNNFSGSLSNRVNDLIGSVPDILQIVIDKMLSTLIAIFISVFILWHVSSAFGATMLIWAIIFILGTGFISKYLVRLSDNYSEQGSIVTGKIVDALSNILLIRLFARISYEKRILGESINKIVKAERKLWWMYFWIWCFNGYSFLIVMVLNFYFLIKGYKEGWVTVGDFALVSSISIEIISALWELAYNLSHLSKHFGKVTQALRVILVVPEIVDAKGAKLLKIKKGEIEFEKVKFHYKDAKALFENKSIIISAGQKVGLVGYSGSGKTSFVNLILRMFDVTSGRILIDGQDIKTCTQESLRSVIGMIPQDPSLFHRSLMDNIRYGKTDATDKEVIEASKRAHAHEFISRLNDGYGSLVGERGVKLSGGQRQRIAIARAILKNAPILILDEATSQLDSVTEVDIQDSLWYLMQDKTTIVIAHRLSTLLNMDRILVFDKGKIVEDGTHAELLKNKGLYKTLWDAQVGGFLLDKKSDNE